tara:strand:- start:11 stop:595 length:585 start_codon:yes stop_codon:yes gene_type:complete
LTEHIALGNRKYVQTVSDKFQAVIRNPFAFSILKHIDGFLFSISLYRSRKILFATFQIAKYYHLIMSKKYFVNFISEPKNDILKTIVGIACTARAITEGHEVSVFFAASGTRLLDPDFIKDLDQEMGSDSKAVTEMMGVITSKATLYCSFASVKATLGHSEGDGALIVPDEKIKWSGPPGVIELSSASDIQLMY